MSVIHVEPTQLEGVADIRIDAFADHRGRFIETYNRGLYARHGIDIDFVQDDLSISGRDVLRGFHGDNCTRKLVSCIHGRIFFVVLNCDRTSDQCGQWQSFTLDGDEPRQILIPPRFANAYLALSDKIVFTYKQSAYYDRSRQFSVRWNDPRLAIDWPIQHPILSERDRTSPFFAELAG